MTCFDKNNFTLFIKAIYHQWDMLPKQVLLHGLGSKMVEDSRAGLGRLSRPQRVNRHQQPRVGSNCKIMQIASRGKNLMLTLFNPEKREISVKVPLYNQSDRARLCHSRGTLP